MNDIRSILATAYQCAESIRHTDFGLSKVQRTWVETIVEKAESQKGVVAVLITSLVKKIETPTQDVRYHKIELPNGYSGRGFDTEHVTPFIAEKFRRFAMKGSSGSGWLTRSLEQAHPFTLEFPGKIRDRAVKVAFLQILNDIEEHHVNPEKYLHAIFAGLIDLMERINTLIREQTEADFASREKVVTIENIVALLNTHFSIDYGVVGASRLPVLAVYSAYEMLMAIERYQGKTLAPLKSHTTSDLKSGGIGDIEVLDETGNFFEAVEIKHNIPISPALVRDAYQKFATTPVSRYYLLTTAVPDVDGENEVNQIVQQLHTRHGCEVIVNGILPSLKYYLRLLSNPKRFLDCYTKNLQADFQMNTDIKEVHVRDWAALLRSLVN